MGSQAMQAALWGRNPKDWASIQEGTSKVAYEYVLSELNLQPDTSLLDIGCGTGIFCSMAANYTKNVTGFDATEPFIEEARQRAPKLTFLTGEMESLPFNDASQDIVTGFNSFQYAANVPNALNEAKRVLKPNGKLVVMIWGNKEDCDAASYLAAIGRVLPPPPPGAPGPFALSEGKKLEQMLTDNGFKVTSSKDIPTVWDYPNMDIAMKGLLSAGPATKAIDHSGYEKVYGSVNEAVQPYIQPDGHIVYHNKFRVVIATK